MKTYEFKLYRTKKEQHLWKQLDIANEVWNFCITARRWHFKQTGKSLQTFSLQKIITQVKKAPMYQHWNALNSQAIANQADRVWLSYEAFFANLKLPKKERRKISLPGYKKRSKQKSFTLRQVGEALDQQHNRIRIGGKWFKYHKSREVEGNIKTITVKQNKLGEWFIYVVSDHTETAKQTRTGKSVGFDFGLKQFLTGSDGSVFTMPLLFKRTLRELAKAHRNIESKTRKQEQKEGAQTPEQSSSEGIECSQGLPLETGKAPCANIRGHMLGNSQSQRYESPMGKEGFRPWFLFLCSETETSSKQTRNNPHLH